MFVRWQDRRLTLAPQRRRQGRDDVLNRRCLLVESRRVNGRPRLSHIAFLGSIRVGKDNAMSVWRRAEFFDEVAARLDRLANRIIPDERCCIEAAIEKRVPRPTAEEIEENQRMFDKWVEAARAILPRRRFAGSKPGPKPRTRTQGAGQPLVRDR